MLKQQYLMDLTMMLTQVRNGIQIAASLALKEAKNKCKPFF
jgi:hypothetical protein